MPLLSVAEGRATASTPDAYFTKPGSSGKAPVVYMTGVTGPAADLADLTIRPLLEALTDRGYTIVAPTSVITYGNATGLSRIDDALAWARDDLGCSDGSAVLIGASEGAADCLTYAYTYPDRVAGVIGMIPVLDLQALRVSDVLNGRALIDTAWGVTYPAALPSAADPADHTTELSEVRHQLWVATDDGVSENYAAFSAASGADLRTVGALGHTLAAMAAADVDSMRRFVVDSTRHRHSRVRTPAEVTATATAALGSLTASAAASVSSGAFDPLSIGWTHVYWASSPNQTLTDGQLVGTATGGGAAGWKDNAASGALDATSAGLDTSRPVHRSSVAGLNSKPAIEFVSSDFLLANVTDMTQPVEVFIVFQFKTASGTFQTLYQGSAGDLYWIVGTDDLWPYAGSGTTGYGNPGTTGHCARVLYQGASSTVSMDGTQIGAANWGSGNMTQVLLGAQTGGGSPLVGYIAFIGYMDGTLTSQQRTDLVTWSRSFYGTP